MVDGWDWRALVLPVLTLVLYDFGYVARMTRASMAEVMTSQYIRTAVLKGLPYRRVILRHALRNALIAPFTIIVLQIELAAVGRGRRRSSSSNTRASASCCSTPRCSATST